MEEVRTIRLEGRRQETDINAPGSESESESAPAVGAGAASPDAGTGEAAALVVEEVPTHCLRCDEFPAAPTDGDAEAAASVSFDAVAGIDGEAGFVIDGGADFAAMPSTVEPTAA